MKVSEGPCNLSVSEMDNTETTTRCVGEGCPEQASAEGALRSSLRQGWSLHPSSEDVCTRFDASGLGPQLHLGFLVAMQVLLLKHPRPHLHV